MAPLTQISVEIIKIVHAVIAEEVIKSCYKYFTSRLSDEGLTLEKNQEYFTKALENNLTRTVNWAKYILFYDLVIDKYTATKYIELDFYLRPLRETGAKVEHKEDLLNEVFNLTDKHIVILGEGGSGKTTSMQMLCSKLLTDEKYLSNSFPLVIRFRDHSNEIRNLNSRQSKKVHYILHTILYHELGLPVKKGDKASEEEFDYLEGAFIKPYIANVLNYLSPLVILDGFDEVEQSARQMILSEIKELCLSCTSARIVVTSRIGDFDYSLPNARKFQIAPFDDKKIIKFCCKWLEDEVRGMKLYDAIKSTPYYDTTMRPINLTMLASLYEANGELPADPKSIYERVIDLHLFRWDKERDVRRGMKIKSFDTRLMRQFIEHLAFHLATENYFTFDKFDLKLIYVNKLLPAFPEVLTEELFESTINEVEVHSGLFVQINDNQFEFAHKSIQEYLAGKYISSYQPILDLRKSLEKLPIEVAIGTGWAVNRNYFFKCARQIFSNPIELELMNVNGSPGLDDDALERVNERLNNYISYIKRLTVEKANFEATTDMGFEILTIWQEVFEFRPDLRNDFWEFFQLRGVRSSFNLLEEFYSINPIEYVRLKKMSAVAISDEKLEFSVDIQLRGGQSRKDKNLPYLRLPLFFVLEWKYVRSYL